ncbi:hypothetical protein HWA77_02950 [Photobacterium damselae subsp. damselae]|uniref:Uncharacterized protein n=1 Tax=Photobacterium damselae subsp. damselae TaxID=85581 RepID=A0A850QKJ1_PHODD|nr:hypothetical protein [Photobacterium damselae subsp. damselae]
MKIISVVEFSPSGSGYFRVEYNSYGSNPDCSGKGSYPVYGTDFYPTESGQYEMLANYCDSEQYHSDLKNQERSCLLSASPNQDASFKGWCNKDSQKLEYTCKLTDKPVEPETCPDGSCGDSGGTEGGGSGGDSGGTEGGGSGGDSGGTGGGGSGGDSGGTGGGGSGGDGGGTGGGGSGDKTDLSSVINAIKSANSNIVQANNDTRSQIIAGLDLDREALIKADTSNKLQKDLFDSVNNLNDSVSSDFERALAEMKRNSDEAEKQRNAQIEATNKVTEAIKSNPDSSGEQEKLLSSLNDNVSKIKDALLSESPAFSTVPTSIPRDILSVSAVAEAKEKLNKVRFEYADTIEKFKNSVSISTNFDEGSLTDDSFKLDIAGNDIKVSSGSEKFLDIAGVIRPIIIMICSLIAVSIIFVAK